MNRDPVDPIPPEAMLGASDWDDEDLLTVTEATTRLDGEIAAARKRVQQAEGAQASDALAAERLRLQQLVAAAERIWSAQARAPR
ncbi:hypothetical protein [[Mycobacterium] vasticus]|uniref:Uncharacterized protein n=1 Tax=[Mycobacterium] vasticus TaxID=2875777 RepID=A0ABU5Z0Q9_9MYCO|nr:hypothetical protein [Mycolicibacter sp. MYC017]MEB3070666.1 hypothetical protein [Mycolicibacter sp. MYC017]